MGIARHSSAEDGGSPEGRRTWAASRYRVEGIRGKSWAGDDDSRDGASDPGSFTGERWLRRWAFAVSQTGLGLTTRQFWGLTPRAFQALTREWEAHQNSESYVFREILATLRNVALGKGWKPPSGEVWTADMLLPESQQTKPESAPDWKKDRDVLADNLRKVKGQAKALTPEGRAQVKKYSQNLKITAERRKHAERLKAEGASPARIKEFLLKGR